MTITRLRKKATKDYGHTQFEIYAIEEFLEEERGGNPPIIFDDKYTIIWVRQGGGELQVDMEKFILEENTAYYIKPRQIISVDIGEDAVGFVISFDREFLELYDMKTSELFNNPLFNPSVTTPVIKISPDVNTFLKSIAVEMLQEYRSFQDLRAEILKGFLKVFIIYLSRLFQNNSPANFWSRKRDLTNLFFSHLEKHFATRKMVKEYAQMLAVTPSYLNDTVKDVSGFTASHHIQQRVVLEAKRRAIFEGYTMKETAYCLGFFDPSHFSKYFKNSSGINFTDFKKGVPIASKPELLQ